MTHYSDAAIVTFRPETQEFIREKGVRSANGFEIDYTMLSNFNAARQRRKPAAMKWPAWAEAVRKLRNESDRGAGDTVARLVPGGDQFKAGFKAVFGFDCGCERRREVLNALYPYKQTPAQMRQSG